MNVRRLKAKGVNQEVVKTYATASVVNARIGTQEKTVKNV